MHTPTHRTRVEMGVVGIPPSIEQLKLLPLPETIVMNFSRICNLWCAHCFYPKMALEREMSPSKKEVTLLPINTFNRVIDEISTWDNQVVLRIASDGEPLMHPQCLDMIESAKRKKLTVALTTNGILLSQKTTIRLLQVGIDVIDISIDAASAEKYTQVRKSRGSFNFYPKVQSNIQNLIELRNQMIPRSSTKIMVNMIDQPLVHGEVDLFIRQWTAWGVDVVLIRPFHSTSNLTPQAGVSNPSNETKRFPCKYPFTRLNVGFDSAGHPIVYYCSHDWEEKTVVGSMEEDGNLSNIWRGKAMEEIRRRHLQNDYPDDSFCARCPDWYLGWGKSHQSLVSSVSKKI